jgi:hypothetical protein
LLERVGASDRFCVRQIHVVPAWRLSGGTGIAVPSTEWMSAASSARVPLGLIEVRVGSSIGDAINGAEENPERLSRARDRACELRPDDTNGTRLSRLRLLPGIRVSSTALSHLGLGHPRRQAAQQRRDVQAPYRRLRRG